MLNRGYAYTTRIGRKHLGQTLLAHLAAVYPHSTPQAWQHNLDQGQLTLDGIPATGAEALIPGQTLTWNRPPWLEPDAPRHFQILFEDAHLLAVDKPSGLPTLPGAGFLENTLLRLVQRHSPAANPVHRLGRATTGIVLFAKTPFAAAQLTAAWNTPKVQKIYRALSQNGALENLYDIRTPIALVPHPLLGSIWAASPPASPTGQPPAASSAKPSRSVARVLARTPTTTTFEVTLYSGRPHQIRIHLASIGYPLLGDPLYGPTGQPLAPLPGLPGDGGYLLHAHRLTLPHPVTHDPLHLEAPLPPGLSQ